MTAYVIMLNDTPIAVSTYNQLEAEKLQEFFQEKYDKEYGGLTMKAYVHWKAVPTHHTAFNNLMEPQDR